jgi:hypothetical protein
MCGPRPPLSCALNVSHLYSSLSATRGGVGSSCAVVIIRPSTYTISSPACIEVAGSCKHTHSLLSAVASVYWLGWAGLDIQVQTDLLFVRGSSLFPVSSLHSVPVSASGSAGLLQRICQCMFECAFECISLELKINLFK